jgi:hypothetical protein
MRRLSTAFYLVAILILAAISARPYTLQFTDASGSVQIKWPTHTIKIALSTSLVTQQSNIKPGSDVIGAVRRALAHWAEAANIRFIISSSNVQSISAQGTRGDGLSLITVAHTPENVAPFAGEDSEMAARTRIFSTVGGSITEADMALNPGQSFSSDGTRGTYDLEATFTHEIGHLLGLEHSAVLGATMQPRQAKNGIYQLTSPPPRVLSDDDRAGVQSIYGVRAGQVVEHGGIAGTITFTNGDPVFGANIIAEDAATGRVIASNITLANGTYRIESLPPGNYRIIAEPLNEAVSAAEIASPRGAYAGLALYTQLPFRAEELGAINVKPDTTAALSAQLSLSPALVVPSFIGTNGELSSVAVPLVPGNTYQILVGGSGLNAAQFASAGITTTSPFIVVDPVSVENVEFGNGLSVIGFKVAVSAGAGAEVLAGNYSLRLQSLTGEVAYIAGCLRIESPEKVTDVGQSMKDLARDGVRQEDNREILIDENPAETFEIDTDATSSDEQGTGSINVERITQDDSETAAKRAELHGSDSP